MLHDAPCVVAARDSALHCLVDRHAIECCRGSLHSASSTEQCCAHPPNTHAYTRAPPPPQEQYTSLAEAMALDPSSVEAADRQHMERLATTLHRRVRATP